MENGIYRSSSGKKKVFYILTVVVFLVAVALVFIYIRSLPGDEGRNFEMEAAFRKIVESEMLRQKEKGIIISIKKIEVLNLKRGATKGSIILNCGEEISSEAEMDIFESIAGKIMEKYPNKFKEGKGTSTVDVDCS